MSRKLQLKRGNKAQLPTLAPGEPGWVVDENRLYIGTGDQNIPIGNSGDIAAHNTASDAHSAQFAGKAALGKAYTGTLSVTGWTGSGPYTQVVSIAGLKEPRLRPDFALITSGTKATDLARWESWAYIQRVVAEDGKITVTCYEDKPTVALPFTLEVHD